MLTCGKNHFTNGEVKTWPSVAAIHHYLQLSSLGEVVFVQIQAVLLLIWPGSFPILNPHISYMLLVSIHEFFCLLYYQIEQLIDGFHFFAW